MKHQDIPPDCFAHQKFLLNIFGLLSNQNTFYKLYSFILLTVITIYPVAVIPEVLKIYYTNFNEFISSMLFEIGQITGAICMHCMIWNRYELKQLFEKLKLLDELSNFGNTESGKMFIKSYKDIVRKQSYFGSSSIVFVIIAYISVSVVLSLNEDKWILPFGCGPAIENNNLQLIIQILIFSITAIIIYLQLYVYINVLTLICGHFKLLQKYLIISFTGYKGDLTKEFDEKLIKEQIIIDWASFKIQLRYIIPYHIGINDAANQMESNFSLIVLTFFSAVSINLCLLIYHIQLNIEIAEILKDLILILSGYLLLILISSYGEKVTTESGKLANICYEMDFADSDIRIQKSLMFIMLRCQKPITPTIGKLRVLNLRTMLSIFQSIYTYYTFLQNMKSE